MAYPALHHFTEDELRDHFFLGPEDFELVKGYRHERNQLGLTIFLKTYQFLGYPPQSSYDIPGQIVECLASQLGLTSESFENYAWRGRVWMEHLAFLRKQLSWRAFEGSDGESVQKHLFSEGEDLLSRSEWLKSAVKYLRNRRIELPQKPELLRLVNSARRKFEERLFLNISSILDESTRNWLDSLLEVNDGASSFDLLKNPPGKPGKKTFLEEANRLQILREFSLERKDLQGFSDRRFRALCHRVRTEDASLMKKHPPERRFPLLAIWLCARKMEITDHLVSLFLHVIKRVEKKGREELKNEVELSKVYGTRQLLHQIVKACREKPGAPIGEVILGEVGEETLQALYAEIDAGRTSLEAARTEKIQKKFRGYQKMVSSLLDVLDFRTRNGKREPLLQALAIIAKHADSKKTYITEKIPEELIAESWKETLYEETSNGPRVRRRAFEVCVLSQLEEALKCKEIWVEGGYKFRDPNEDLPDDWEKQRPHYYQRINLPLSSKEFVRSLKAELEQALEQANQFQKSRRQDSGGPEIRRTAKGKATLHVPTPSKRPERVILKEIKDRVGQHFGVLDLLDVLAEVDRRVNLVSHFQTTGQRRVLGEEETRKRLLFVLFSLGTNLGLKRLHSAARPDCSYDDLRYFMRRFITPEALKEANISLVNHILELRNSDLWGDGTSCASDGKFLAAWDKNITAEWNPHYKGRGVKVYWHVEQGAVAIHSMLKTPSCTEVAPMIEGVVHHGTLAAIEMNCVDTGGQSLPAFGLCRPLQFELLPRFRQVKRFQLNLPYKEMASKLPALSGVTTRSIRWDLIEEHYDDYARHAAAILERTGPVESILRRFTRHNRPHPTYKALLEIGRAERTIYLCRLLSEPDLHVKVHDQLNGIEHWNSCNQFICFARRSELRTNDPVMQELIIGSLHLLQNAMVLANTLMMERVITNDVLERMTTEDIYSLTPLFTSSINPYGEFDLDLNKPSFLEAV